MFKLKNLPLTVSLVIVISLIVGWGISMVLAWIDPTADPPLENVDAPINVGSTAQTKTGNLTVNLMRADEGFNVDGNTVIDADAGWHSSYNNTGWYNATHGGGWYMIDATYVRTYNNKSIYIGGSGNSYFGGRVGVGTTDPQAKFHVKAAGTYECVGTATSCESFDGDQAGCQCQGGCQWGAKLCSDLEWTECKITSDCSWDTELQKCLGLYLGCYGFETSCSSLTTQGSLLDCNDGAEPLTCLGQEGCSWVATAPAAVFEDGRVGVGVISPAYRLELPNTANEDGRARANQWVTYSSKRWKENITEISATEALDKIMRLRPVRFTWKPEHGGLNDIGFISEEVGEVIPEAVEWSGGHADGLSTDQIIALLTRLVKAQQQEIEKLKQEIEKLKDITSKR